MTTERFLTDSVQTDYTHQALVMCNALPRLYGQILRDTHHILFLDTPHLGLNTSAWLHIYGRSATDHAVRQLNLWSQGLVDTAKYFGGISTEFSITSVCPTQPIECDGDTIFVHLAISHSPAVAMLLTAIIGCRRVVIDVISPQRKSNMAFKHHPLDNVQVFEPARHQLQKAA
jgi:hypothetical protein